MKKNKKLLSAVLTVIIVLSVCAVISATAAAVSVTRDLPDTPVSPEEEITVSLTQSGFLLNIGIVNETLPEGFTYVPDSLTGNANATFDATTNNLTINFESETMVTYIIESGMAEQIENAVFSGTYKTFDGGLNPITGGVEGDTTLTLATPTPMPVFDTGSGTYPSISGIHNGSIEPNQTITVSKIYTYSCPGTGGHSEYVRIGGNRLDVNATWEGYGGDWHNITFDEPFMLKANLTYNYTIRTGSYPQIIHAKEFNATGGKITCEEFIDANGKRYVDWIPAIRLLASSTFESSAISNENETLIIGFQEEIPGWVLEKYGVLDINEALNCILVKAREKEKVLAESLAEVK